MHKLIVFLFLFISSINSWCQSYSIEVKVVDVSSLSLQAATVELLKADTSLLKVQVTDSAGSALFTGIANGTYILRASRVGYQNYYSPAFILTSPIAQLPVTLHAVSGELSNITISARKPFIELQPGKTVVNLEAGITNSGTTAMEALEKLPGITIDKDGNISLKGRSGVTVMIDGKQTYLDPAQLSTLLNGMSSAQIGQVEIMDQPGARFDAAGNAGIINIKTKKSGQKGFNGSISTSYAQGVYPKNNNSLQLNFRSGSWVLFLNYSANISRNFTRIYALRTYLEEDGKTVATLLEQPTFLASNGQTHNLRTGVEYSMNAKTSVGITFTGLFLNRKGNGNNPALWMSPNRTEDSLIQTISFSNTQWKNGGANFNFKHMFSPTGELTFDFDAIGYRIRGDQFFENNLIAPTNYSEAARANIPSDINILSAKADYTGQWKSGKWEAGWKTSRIHTNNLAEYDYRDGATWKPDLGKTNHFLYNENIHALYTSAQFNMNKWTVQGGLRYEMTGYEADQLGNAIVKDSAFSRNYNSLFPSFFTSYKIDSSNTISFSAGRRIDRPAFQKLNPFLFIINKYTYQRGNPFYRPQYTWNMELSHSYKGFLLTGLGYSITRDYFSQVFPIDSNGIVLYTEGNLGKLKILTLSIGTQVSPTGWWNVSAQAAMNHKNMQGFVERMYNVTITQFHFNLNNQFRMQKGWAAELSGFYTSKSQNDIQEIVDPAGQLSIGISKSVFNNKGTLKLAARDLFYTQWMKGNTFFTGATEYFKLTRDTRLANLSFTYRFGKTFKTTKRSSGAAGEEIQRVGNG